MKMLLLSTIIICAIGSIVSASSEAEEVNSKLFLSDEPDENIKIFVSINRIKGSEYAEYVQGMPIVIGIRLVSIPTKRKRKKVSGNFRIYPEIVDSIPGRSILSTREQDEVLGDPKMYISKSWPRNIVFALYNADGASVGSKVGLLKQDEVTDASTIELRAPGVFDFWVIEGEKTKNLQPGKYILETSLGSIGKTNSFVITKYQDQQESLCKVSRAWVSYLRGEYGEAIEFAKTAMEQGGRMVTDKRNYAIDIMALSYERLGDDKEALHLWEEYLDKRVLPKSNAKRKGFDLIDMKVSTLKKRIKNSDSQKNPNLNSLNLDDAILGLNTILSSEPDAFPREELDNRILSVLSGSSSDKAAQLTAIRLAGLNRLASSQSMLEKFSRSSSILLRNAAAKSLSGLSAKSEQAD